MEGTIPGHIAPELDEEGFPVASVRSVSGAWQNGRDEESGEWLQQRVYVFRHTSRNSAPTYEKTRPKVLQEVFHIQHINWPLNRTEQVLRCEPNLVSCLSQELRRTRNNTRHHHQPSHPKVPEGDSHGLKTHAVFHVPPGILRDLSLKDSRGDKARVHYITIWKEFIYAPSVLMLERRHHSHNELHGIKPVTSRLSKFVNRKLVDWSLYVFFFGVYFLYCCIFHDLLELCLYLLFGNHLSIHYLASCSNIDVAFKGSVFEGPAYALIRMCCQHCTQRENAKVMWRHMAKMKRDIRNTKVG